jgi:hypothetical protein
VGFWSILEHPVFYDELDLTPCEGYSMVEKVCCGYTEWIRGDDGWNMEVWDVQVVYVSLILNSCSSAKGLDCSG